MLKHNYWEQLSSENAIVQLFPSSGVQLEQCILACKSEQPTAGCIAIIRKTWGYYNKFDFMISLGNVTDMSKYHNAWYVGHGLEYIMFHVQKPMAPLAVCSALPLVRPLCEICLWDTNPRLTLKLRP